MTLHHKKYGEAGPAMLILHGLFGMLDNWATLARRFSEDYAVYALDLRNHGKSDHHPDMNYKVMSEDVAEFCQEHELKDIILIGHSMGGKVAMQFSVDHSDLLSHLIVADISPRAYSHGHTEVFDAFYGADLTAVTRRSEADKQLEGFLPDFGTRQFILKNLDRKKDGSYGWKPALDIIRDSYSKIIDEITYTESIKVPTCFIRGEKSKYIQESDWLDIRDMYTEVQLETLTDAGHWLHAEQPDGFYDAVINFLN